MNVVVEIANREALPVWVLPYVTSWRLSPDMLLKRLADPSHDTGSTFPTAFNLDMHGRPSPLPPAQWHEIEDLIARLEQDLTNLNLPEYDDRKAWKDRSIKEFWDYEPCYVWLDEFEKWYERFIRCGYISDKGENTELCFNPNLPKEHAQYFESNYAGIVKLTPKAALDKQDEAAQKVEAKLLNERQKAVAEIKASRTPDTKLTPSTSELSVNITPEVLLQTSVADLLAIRKPCDGDERHRVLCSWARVLDSEMAVLCSERRGIEIGRQEFEKHKGRIQLKKAEIARYLDDVAGDEMEKSALDKQDAEAQEEQKFKNGWSHMALAIFVDCLLAEATGKPQPLSTLYRLMEENGLVVYDKTIEGREVQSDELLAALRQRERQAEDSCDDDSFQFWEPLKKESRYQVLRKDVALAYRNAGKLQFPWLDLYSKFVLLDVPSIYPPDFLEKWQNKFGQPHEESAIPEPDRYFDKWAEINDHERKIKEYQLDARINALDRDKAIEAERAKIDAIRKEIDAPQLLNDKTEQSEAVGDGAGNETPGEYRRNINLSIEDIIGKSVAELLALSRRKPERKRTLVAVEDSEDEAIQKLHDLLALEDSKKKLEKELIRVKAASYQFEESRKADINQISAQIAEIEQWLDNYRTVGKLESKAPQHSEVEPAKKGAEERTKPGQSEDDLNINVGPCTETEHFGDEAKRQTEVKITSNEPSCGKNAIHKLIDRAYYLAETQKANVMPADVMDLIKKERKESKEKPSIDVDSIIDKIDNNNKIHWITLSQNKAKLGYKQFGTLVGILKKTPK